MLRWSYHGVKAASPISAKNRLARGRRAEPSPATGKNELKIPNSGVKLPIPVCLFEQNPLALAELTRPFRRSKFQIIGEIEIYDPQYSSLGARLILVLDEKAFAPQNRVLFRTLRSHFPDAKILVLGAQPPSADACRFLADLDGFILYADAKRQLVPALLALSNNQPVLPSAMSQYFLLRGLHPAAKTALPLTPRELEIGPLICAGLSYKEIADKIGRSVRTAKLHVTNIYGKLDVHNRDDAAAILRSLSLTRPVYLDPAHLLAR